MHVLQEITSMDAETLKECKSIASASLDLPIFSHHGCVPLYPEPFSVEDMIGCDEIQQYWFVGRKRSDHVPYYNFDDKFTLI